MGEPLRLVMDRKIWEFEKIETYLSLLAIR
jgi:hypothetical protein